MTLPKYATALLSIAILLVTALTTALAGGLDAVESVQLTALAAGAVVTYVVPLVSGPWVGALKTGAAVIVAIATAVIPFVAQGYIAPEQIAVVALAALNAVAVQIGVGARVDATRTAVIESDGSYTVTDVGAARALGL